MSTILIVVLVLLLIGALPRWPHSRRWGYFPSGGLGLLLLILLLLLLTGRIRCHRSIVTPSEARGRMLERCRFLSEAKNLCSEAERSFAALRMTGRVDEVPPEWERPHCERRAAEAISSSPA